MKPPGFDKPLYILECAVNDMVRRYREFVDTFEGPR